MKERKPDFARGIDREKRTPEEEEGPDFARGIDREKRTPEEEEGPDFARGARTGPEEEAERKRRFSEGIERSPESD
jgi:hypothetical protein